MAFKVISSACTQSTPRNLPVFAPSGHPVETSQQRPAFVENAPIWKISRLHLEINGLVRAKFLQIANMAVAGKQAFEAFSKGEMTPAGLRRQLEGVTFGARLRLPREHELPLPRASQEGREEHTVRVQARMFPKPEKTASELTSPASNPASPTSAAAAH